VNTIGSYFRYFVSSLNDYDETEARSVAAIAFEYVMGLRRIDLTIRSEETLNEDKQKKLNIILSELKAGKPIQHITNEAWFYGMKLFVNEHVLIPRRETEELVELIVRDTKETPDVILDFCTGSGCIALALKKAFPGSVVKGFDVSEMALNVARKNAKENSLDVEWIECDLLNNFPNEKADLIVSNPPYVLRSETTSLAARVKNHEPHVALFVPDNDPLVFYRTISNQSVIHSPGAHLYYEINEILGKEISELHSQMKFTNPEILKDMQGKDRFFRGVVPGRIL
jgi:release factor glutamine methyltransferase